MNNYEEYDNDDFREDWENTRKFNLKKEIKNNVAFNLREYQNMMQKYFEYQEQENEDCPEILEYLKKLSDSVLDELDLIAYSVADNKIQC